MQELLTDELTGARVIVAPGRAIRPHVFRVEASASTTTSCPFCPGRETETPPEVARLGGSEPDTPGWRLRIVPNMYPIVGDGVPGTHEVVILSPTHADIAALDVATTTDALLALRDRSAHHLSRGLVHAQPFVNHGRAAGASIAHPHAQLVALEMVPPAVNDLLNRFATANRDLVADACEAARGQPYLIADGPAVVWCPPASPSPFFTRIALPYARQRFDQATDDEIRALASALRDLIRRVHDVLGDVAYNVAIRTAPRDDPRPFHWWVDVVPRVTVAAGFELGTGIWVNVVPPDMAAGALRDATP